MSDAAAFVPISRAGFVKEENLVALVDVAVAYDAIVFSLSLIWSSIDT